MKQADLPQDPGPLESCTRELGYVVDETGTYQTGKSKGWKVKVDALGVAWNDISNRTRNAFSLYKEGSASPILYYMELNVMEPGILASYAGLWTWQVKRHMKPAVFSKLSEKRIKKYAEIFGISTDELKNPSPLGDPV